MQFGPGAVLLFCAFLYMSPKITVAYTVGYVLYFALKDYFGSPTAINHDR